MSDATLVGEPPYTGPNAQAVLGQIIAGEAASAAKHRTSVPVNVDAALRCALEKIPADRFTSAQELAKALGDEHFRYGELATVGANAPEGPWNRLTIATTTLAAVLTLTLAWVVPPSAAACTDGEVHTDPPGGSGPRAESGCESHAVT